MATLLLSLILACDTEPPCGGLDPAEGEEVTAALTTLGYGDFEDTGLGWSELTLPVIATEESWATSTAGWGTDGGLSPDFATQAVWPHFWRYGGCNESYEYSGWRWGDTLRVRALHLTERNSCDAAFPQLDLLLVELAGATDLGWCE